LHMASSEDHVWSWSTREVFGDGTIRFHCGVQGARRLWDDDLCRVYSKEFGDGFTIETSIRREE